MSPDPEHAGSGPHPLLDPGGKIDPQALRRAVELAGPDDPEARRVVFTLQRDINDRLDRYLTSRIPFMSRSQIQRLIDDGYARVNDRVARASSKLRLGDRVDLVLPPPPSGEIEPEDIPIDVLYEDEHLIALNKRADIIVHPARSHNTGTMLSALAWHFRQGPGGALSPVGAELARPGVVHRLDRDTTGVIVFAKTEEAHWKLARQFEERTTDKRYLAIVSCDRPDQPRGSLHPDMEAIDEPIGPHPSKEKGYREKQVVRHDQLGKPSLTIARVRERYRLHERPVGSQHFALLELELKTGRTHQIRVHCAHRGWPIVGDDMYGGRAFELPAGERIDRQMLHAALLAFEHPITGRPMVLTAPPRPDMLALIAHLRAHKSASTHPEGCVPLSRLGLPESGV
ncbi:MAG: RluA family pseudouridine synthase [Phycisphaeraceae bacterium]|nr:RluA family pseudouridine synthase [Phycisphaeraceae bacterium]